MVSAPSLLCLVCREHKARSSFYPSSLAHSTYRCRSCVKEYNRKYNARRRRHPGFRLMRTLVRWESKLNSSGKHELSSDVTLDSLWELVKATGFTSGLTGEEHPPADLVVVRANLESRFHPTTNALVLSRREGLRHMRTRPQ